MIPLTSPAEATTTSPYASLTKLRDAVTEAKALKSSAETTAELTTEMAREFEEFTRDSWMQVLGGQSLAAFTAAPPVEEKTAEQALALITVLLQTEAMIAPGAVHQPIIDKSMSRYLERLDDLR